MQEHEILNKKTISSGFIILVHLPWNQVTPWATYKTPFHDVNQVVAGVYHRTEDAAKVDFVNRKW